MTDLVVKCTQYRMPMKMTHCLTKCGYAIRGDKPCTDLASFIDTREAEAIPLIAKTPCSAPFSRAFAVDVARAREFALTKIIPAKTASTPPKTAPEAAEPFEPTPAPVVPPLSAVVPKEPVVPEPEEPEVPTAMTAAKAAEPTPVVAAPVAAPVVLAPTTPAASAAAPVESPKARRAPARAPVDAALAQRGLVGIPRSMGSSFLAAAPAPAASGLLIMVETRAKSGKFIARGGDIGEMLSLRAAGRRVIVVTEVEKTSKTDKSLTFTETSVGSGKYILKSAGGPAVLKAVVFHEL